VSKQNGAGEMREHDEVMQLHQANQAQAQHAQSPAEQARLLDTMIESELDVSDDALANLRAKDFPLGNYDDEGVDTTEFKWIQEITRLLARARYPHPDSGLQGLSRAWATGDQSNRKEALGLHDLAKDEAYMLGTFSRAKRGEDMAQQETSAKQVTESHAIRESDDSGGGGILGWRS
jgi:hypothetical protein